MSWKVYYRLAIYQAASKSNSNQFEHCCRNNKNICLSVLLAMFYSVWNARVYSSCCFWFFVYNYTTWREPLEVLECPQVLRYINSCIVKPKNMFWKKMKAIFCKNSHVLGKTPTSVCSVNKWKAQKLEVMAFMQSSLKTSAQNWNAPTNNLKAISKHLSEK